MGRFRCTETNEIVERDVNWRKFEEDGRHYVRIPKERPKSRSERRNDIVSSLNDLSGEFERIKETLTGVDYVPADRHAIIKAMKDWVAEVEGQAGEVENLKGELEDWKESIPENLQGGDKYQQLEEAIETLDSVIDRLGEVDAADKDNDEEEIGSQLDENVDAINDAVSDLENVEFPGMFS